MTEKPYSEIFPDCIPTGFSFDTMVLAVHIRSDEQGMTVVLQKDPPEAWKQEAERLIQNAFQMKAVAFSLSLASPEHNPNTPTARPKQPAKVHKNNNSGLSAQKPLWGKPLALAVTPMDNLPFEEANLSVCGKIFKVEDVREHRGRIQNGWGELKTLTFYITDHLGALRVSCSFEKKNFPSKLEAQIKDTFKNNRWITVQGAMTAVPFKDKEEWILLAKCILPYPVTPRQDEAPHKRVELHLHTQMSATDAITPISEAIATAARWGHPAIAVTDHGVVHAFPEAMKAAKKHNIQVIYGCEGYLEGNDKGYYHIILLAKNQQGLQNLYRLVSLSHVDYFYKRPILPRDLLNRYREGLILGSACERGEVFTALRKGLPWDEVKTIAQIYDYLEIQPICNNLFMVRNGLAADEEQLRDWNRDIVRLGKELIKPVCATGDVHFLEPEDEIHRKVLLAPMGMDTENPTPLYFKTTEEMLSEFSYLGEEDALSVVVRAPMSLTAQCEPIDPVRSGEYFPKIEGSAQELQDLAYGRARELYGTPIPELIQKRLDIELGSIIKKGYDIIYIIAQKLVKRSLDEGYLVGSRGSVGSSIAAYFAGITEVNALPPHYRCPQCRISEFPPPEELNDAACGADMPAKNCPQCGNIYEKDGFDIPFATFLGFEADKKPDIDLNFSGEYQERAHAHTVEIFGAEKVFRAGTITTLQEKNAMGYALKYQEKGNHDLQNAGLLYLAKGCEGVKTTTGQHPGGLIIVPEDNEIYDFCPVQYSANKKQGMVCTHFDYHAIEENLLKLDLLGHDGPTFIRHLEDLTGVDNRKIPLDDPQTMSIFVSSKVLGYENDALLGEAGSVGIPEFGTKFVRGMLRKTRPGTFDELVRISGLSHGTDVWRGNAEDLVDSGKATLKEIICARDDITLFLISRGLPPKLSFTISETVRKGKGLKPEWEAEMRGHQIPEWYIGSCNKIRYMFPKAHAVAYVMLSVRIAWFKVHHPEAFYAAYFSLKTDAFDYTLCALPANRLSAAIKKIETDKSSTKTEQDKAIVMEAAYEMKLRGIPLLPLDIYKADPIRFIPKDGGLIPPLLSVPGLGETAARSIAAERENGSFISEENLLNRTKATTAHIQSMRACGALGNMPETSQITLF